MNKEVVNKQMDGNTIYDRKYKEYSYFEVTRSVVNSVHSFELI